MRSVSLLQVDYLTSEDMPFQTVYIVTCRAIARKRVDKHVSLETDSLKPARYGTHFHGYEWSTNTSLDTGTLYKIPFRSE
jgi:hypothetical protein